MQTLGKLKNLCILYVCVFNIDNLLKGKVGWVVLDKLFVRFWGIQSRIIFFKESAKMTAGDMGLIIASLLFLNNGRIKQILMPCFGPNIEFRKMLEITIRSNPMKFLKNVLASYP